MLEKGKIEVSARGGKVYFAADGEVYRRLTPQEARDFAAMILNFAAGAERHRPDDYGFKIHIEGPSCPVEVEEDGDA